MARPRSFEPEDAAATAMSCFREHGYAATSIRDLEAATGLKAPSLYKVFGNKASLFRLAVERYRTTVVERRIAVHLRSDRGLRGIETFFSSTYRDEPRPTHGCLLTNSCIEFDAIDAAAKHQVRYGLEQMREALEAQVEHCQAIGEVDPTIDAAATAAMLLVLYEGLLVVLRTSASPPAIDLDTVIRTALGQIAVRQPR